ncbi:MAG: threonine/serine dehydratase [Vicinamibacteria bacterium]|nr:threonine/serine dehydratase [Vicinamibacteria bacterium]
MTTLVEIDAIQRARQRIAGVVRVTPLLPASSDEAWVHLWLKCENLQAGGAFKLRGAFNFVSQLDPAIRARGVITYSSGNHGQAMALAARRLGAPAVVVMPTTAPAVKVEGARAFGAEVRFAGTTSIDRRLAAEALASERGVTIVPPFDHADIIAGQGTVGLEIVDQRPDVTTVYVPVGGGGLVSGVAAAVKRLAPSVRVIGVEPAGAPKMTRSLAAGEPTTLDSIDSIADGLLAVRPGDLTFAHVQALVDEVVTVSDDEIREAMRFLVRQSKIVAEPSGAASVAGALRMAPEGSRGVHVAVVSGGNLEMSVLRAILEGVRPN